MSLHILIVFLASLVLQTNTGVRIWKSDDLKARGDALAPKMGPDVKVATEPLGSDANRSFMVAHREGPGQAEWHDSQADVMFIVSGEATMVYGGTIVEGKTVSPGEIRGPAIRDGVEVKLGPGDVLNIPPKTPHQMKLNPGARVTYFVTKVTQ